MVIQKQVIYTRLKLLVIKLEKIVKTFVKVIEQEILFWPIYDKGVWDENLDINFHREC